MKEYTPVFSSEFLRITKRLKKDLRIELEKVIEKVLEDPKKGKPLSYRFKGYWSIRIGKYRIIYGISGNKVIFLTFKHRKRVYK